MAPEKLKLAILISGRGSNMRALLDACADPSFPARVVAVMSNRPDAQGLQIAREAGIPVQTVDHRRHESRESFENALHEAIAGYAPDLICLAGFMRILGADFIARWPDRIINIHPSLLPAYKGLHVHERVLADGCAESGCTVHIVVPELDAGPAIVQKRVPVLPGDTPDDLAARVLEREHEAYPEAVRLIGDGRVRIVDGAVEIR